MRRALLLLALLTASCLSAEEAVGYRPAPFSRDHLTNALPAEASGARLRLTASSLPSSYDLRNEDGKGTSYLSPVRNQNPYGTCWTFAALACLEYRIRKDEGLSTDLSENNLANLHGFEWAFDEGGNNDIATAVFLREEGPVSETLDPYPRIGASVRERAVRVPRKVIWVPKRSPWFLSPDVTTLKKAIYTYGPLASSYYHNDSYLKGAAYYCSSEINANHAIAIVGWDDNYAKTNFKSTPSRKGAFIVRNSWGSSWGESGYFYISYYDATLAVDAVSVAFQNVTDGSDYGHVYQHDPYGAVLSTGYSSTTAWAANFFTARTDEQLTAFGFYALQPNTTYTASVVVNARLENGSIVGTSTTVRSGTCTSAGYEVLAFTQDVFVGAGTNFAIVVKIKTPDYKYPIPLMKNYSGYLSRVTRAAGKSYTTANPTDYSWTDIGNSETPAYFCCKVYARPTQSEATTCETRPVPYAWLTRYAKQHTPDSDYLQTYFYGAFNALSEHIAANGRAVGNSFFTGLDPDNTTEMTLQAGITFDAAGVPQISITPRNAALWTYTTLGSTDLRGWHAQTAGDRYFKVRVTPRTDP